MKSNKLVLICLGFRGLGTPKVLGLDTSILGLEFLNYGVPLHSGGIVIYNVVEL